MVLCKVFLLALSTVLVSFGRSRGGEVKGQWAGRDSYVKAAEHSAGLKDPTIPYYYFPYPQRAQAQYGQHKSGSGDYYGGVEMNGFLQDEADAKVDPVSIGGILSVVSGAVSSLSWVTTGILAIILAPILLPIILSPLILIGLIIYFIPVIRLELGPDGAGTQQRRSEGRMSEALRHLEATGRLVYQLSANEECLERVACEVGRASALSSMSSWLKSKLDGIQNSVVKRLTRALGFTSAPNSASDCKVFSCEPGRQFRRILKSIGQEPRRRKQRS